MDIIQNMESMLASREQYGSLDFAKFVGDYHDVDFIVPIEEVEPLYRAAETELKEGRFISRDLEQFICRGLDHIDSCYQRAKASGMPFKYMKLKAHTVNRMQQFSKAYELDHLLPKYLPETFTVENALCDGPRYLCYFKWTTVEIRYIDRLIYPALSKLIIEYEAALREERSAEINVVRQKIKVPPSVPVFGSILKVKSTAAPIANAAKPEATSLPEEPEISVFAYNPEFIDDEVVDGLREELEFQQLLQREINEQVQYSMFVARRYMDKVQDAHRRAIQFTMTIEDFAALLRNRVCHFTGVPLTVDIGATSLQNRKIPDNYVSIDRLDSNKGYTRDNVVVCAHSVNVAKSRLPEHQFKQIASIASLMSTISEEQKAALRSLMSLEK